MSRDRSHRLPSCVAFAALIFAGGAARADTLHDQPAPPDPIYGGERVAPCGWPTTVYVSDCTGTLVHPELVIYASHCGTSVSEVFFGDAVGEPGRSVATTRCEAHNLGTGTDWAFCTLAEPVTDIPVTPPLMGCETEMLQPQLPLWIVGFGELEDGSYGTKYEAQSKLFEIRDNEAFIGGDGADTCFGDSGGPAYVQLEDGSWRAFGITSYAEVSTCGTGTWFSMMHIGMAWFESTSGIDITPCHDADGTWNPGPDCGGFPISPMDGGGSWAAGCSHSEVSELSSTCGPAYGATDDTPPTVSITEPVDGTEFADDGTGNASLTVTMMADDGPGSTVAAVQLLLDGVPLGGADMAAPWQYDVIVARGSHVLTATATDAAGNVGNSAAVEIVVGEPDDTEDDDAGLDDGTDDGDTDDDGGDVDSEGSGDDGQATGEAAASGCGCSSGRDVSSWWWLGLPLVRLTVRRPTRRRPRAARAPGPPASPPVRC